MPTDAERLIDDAGAPGHEMQRNGAALRTHPFRQVAAKIINRLDDGDDFHDPRLVRRSVTKILAYRGLDRQPVSPQSPLQLEEIRPALSRDGGPSLRKEARCLLSKPLRRKSSLTGT